MVKENKVLIEKFKGFEIYYDKDKEKFTADKERLDIHFEASRLWEIQGRIKETQTEEVSKEYLIKSGYFGQQMSKINLMTKNKATSSCTYKILESTKEGYNIGKIERNEDVPKLYPVSKSNLKLYAEVMKLQREIEKLERKQEKLVNELA